MRILAVDTTRRCANIFIVSEKFNKCHTLSEDEKQSEFLMLNIDKFLKENSLLLSDIDMFGVINGPGSFTGIRVGVATIKAFSYALNKEIVCCSVFDVVKDEINNGIFLIECTSNSCYFADIVEGKILETGVIEKDKINSLKKPIFVLQEEHNLINLAYKLNVLKNYSNLCCVKLFKMAANNEFSKPEPYYIQASQAERNLEQKHD